MMDEKTENFVSKRPVTVADIYGKLPMAMDYFDNNRAFRIIGTSAEVYICDNRVDWRCYEARVVTDQSGVTRVYLAGSASDFPEGLR